MYRSDPVFSAVQQDGVFARAGVRAGDVLTSVNGLAMSDPGAMSALGATAQGEAAVLVVRRGQERIEIRVPRRSIEG